MSGEERVPAGPANHHQTQQLLDACFYYMKPEMRAKLIRELPEAYNAYVGWQVVVVVHTTDGRQA